MFKIYCGNEDCGEALEFILECGDVTEMECSECGYSIKIIEDE